MTQFMRCANALLSFGLLVTAAQAAPGYAEARAIADEMNRIVFATNLWNKKPLQQRISETKKAGQMVARAETIFGASPGGPYAPCRAAAISAQFYITALNDYALFLEGRKSSIEALDLYAPMFNAFQFGEHYRSCVGLIEALAQTAK